MRAGLQHLSIGEGTVSRACNALSRLLHAFVSGGQRATSEQRAHHQALPALLRVTLLWLRLGSTRAALCQLQVELNVAGLTKREFRFAPEKCD